MVSFLYCNSLTVKILNHITKISIDDLGDNAMSIDKLIGNELCEGSVGLTSFCFSCSTGCSSSCYDNCSSGCASDGCSSCTDACSLASTGHCSDNCAAACSDSCSGLYTSSCPTLCTASGAVEIASF